MGVIGNVRASEGGGRTADADFVGSLSDKALDSLKSLQGLGKLSGPLLVTGKSGVRHSFTFGFGDSERPYVACDLVEGSEPLDETKVLSLFIKVYDIGAKNAILCAVPSLVPQAKKLASLYKIIVIEARDRNDATARVAEVLQKISKPK
jgi:hypothetical protein